MVSNCETWLKFSANNKPQAIQPTGTWSSSHTLDKSCNTHLICDNCNYLLMVDYMSKFHIFCKLPSMIARVVTEMVKSIFSEYDKLTTIVSDNGPCYSSEYLAREMAKCRINHTTTLPHHYQSNGLAEIYGKISKAILKKVKDANEDPHLAILAYRTTTIWPTTPTSMALGHGCKPRGNLPIVYAALRAKGIVVEAAKSLKNQQKSDENHFIKR